MRSMRLSPDNIPGQRQPTAQEHAYIAAHWGNEINRRMHKKRGSLPRYFGIFLIITGMASATRPGADLPGILVTLALAACCLGFSSLLKNMSRRKDTRLKALATANYLVAPATAWDLFTGHYQSGIRTALARINLPGGQVVDEVVKVPLRCADPLLKQKVQHFPVLLVILPGDPELLAIPQQDIQ